MVVFDVELYATRWIGDEMRQEVTGRVTTRSPRNRRAHDKRQ